MHAVDWENHSQQTALLYCGFKLRTQLCPVGDWLRVCFSVMVQQWAGGLLVASQGFVQTGGDSGAVLIHTHTHK